MPYTSTDHTEHVIDLLEISLFGLSEAEGRTMRLGSDKDLHSAISSAQNVLRAALHAYKAFHRQEVYCGRDS